MEFTSLWFAHRYSSRPGLGLPPLFKSCRLDQHIDGSVDIVGETSDSIYFIAINAINELDLWFTDGTTAGTQVRNIENTGNDVNVNFARIAGDNIVFIADMTGSTQSLQVAPLTGGNAVELLDANLEHIVGNGLYLISAGSIGEPATVYLLDLTPSGKALVSDLASSDPIIGGSLATLFAN